ncbi:MAG: replication factor C large subunit [Natrialbaceae archaeon]|jgi:replication factor C large subunit
MDWTEKYRPSTLAEVRGNDKARDNLREWVKTWEDHQEAAILHGAPGVGKTSAAHALASDLDWSTIELNASDHRTADVIDRVAGEAAKSGTLTAGGDGRRLIILDEADNIHGTHDRGGTQAITRLVKAASQPMVLIANDFYDMSKGLRNACREIEFRDVSARSIVPVLRDVCRKEGIEFESAALETIAEQTDGDLRSAINDLQAAAEGRDRITEDDVVTSERDRTEGIFDFLDTVIKEAGAEEALKASYDVEETPDDLINWIEDNVPKDYHGAELADAFDSLSKADRWLGRVRATQEYSYWRYAGDNMTAGVAAARRGDKSGWTRYGPPSFWSKLGRSRGTRETRDAIARKIAERAGTSLGTARRHVLPYLAAMTHHCKERELTVKMTAAYDLDASEVSFVTGSGESTNKVQSIVEEARERRDAAIESHAGSAFEGGATRSGSTTNGNEGKAPGQEGSEGNDDDQLTLGDSSRDDEADDGSARADDEEIPEGDKAQKAESDDAQSGLGDFT